MECVLITVQVTKRVINYRGPVYRYLNSENSFHDLHFSYRIGISPARKIEHYVSVFGLSWCRIYFKAYKTAVGNDCFGD